MHKVISFFKKMLFLFYCYNFFKTTVSLMTMNSYTVKVCLISTKDSSVCSIPPDRYANFQARHDLETM